MQFIKNIYRNFANLITFTFKTGPLFVGYGTLGYLGC